MQTISPTLAHFPWKLNKQTKNIATEAPSVVIRKPRRGRPTNAELKAQRDHYNAVLQSQLNMIQQQPLQMPMMDENRLTKLSDVIQTQDLKINLIARTLQEMSQALRGLEGYLTKNNAQE